MEQQATAIIDAVDDLTPEWLSDALGRRVAEVSADVAGIGQVGLVARAQARFEDGSAESFIVKLPRLDPGSRQVGTAMGIYEAEVRFYQEIAPTVDVATPRLHWADVDPPTGRFTLVLEDLGSRGELGDMIAGGTVDQAARVMDALAALQAPRWHDPALRELGWLAGTDRSAMMFAGVEPMLPGFLERFEGLLRDDHVALIERLAPRAMNWPARMLAEPAAMFHGDFRLDNMVFPPDPSEPVIVFDWQALRLGPPLVDACIYLGGCLPEDDRRRCERDLLRTYHESLLARGVTGFTFDDVWQSYRWSIFWGLLLSVPMVMQLERTERGDALFSGMFRAYAQMAVELDSEELL